ncbi:hypothetical protein M2459_001153 [Parabacteroides sp. PF5-5]|uniref:hypothetical protein n=1 Tax=unclassified Parabacteroides TaxID=2649774 RepID=UPI002475158A|nr:MULTISPECIES: hypothetical protein [unclassified Parabacteroides]MDH6304420.1 hypothetical protein [Parabacteroides sp. PH5-39]MDH6315427.1 hypothetical protein [Parabacteroides sp. PF5-13]MDH6319079.1 hypothetical protein [Parabacteroides sp. PH5-13]MDH6322809.1 hypothetical protein [Parabacteroides sp. PH5-8]MDH6326619.1 hypothetical protein [Parabacteroides sp. PH5-41]
MKKNFLLYLLMMVFSITFFSACGDDDDDPKEPETPTNPTETTWKDGLGTFKGGDKDNAYVLKINDGEPAQTKSVALAAGTGENAKITLTNVLPDGAAIEIDNVEMKKSDNTYSFETTKTVGTTEISVSGKLEGIPATKANAAKEAQKTLAINVSRKIVSPLAGTWKLNFDPTGGDVQFNVSTGDPATDMMIGAMGPMLGGMMAQKVTDVTVYFNEDGLFDVNWVKTGEEEATGMPDAIKGMVTINYLASENQVFMALDKSLVSLLGMLDLSSYGLELEDLLALLVEQGDFYLLPINMAIEEDGVSFYASKELLGAVAPMLLPMLGGIELPEGMENIATLLENLPTIIENSETFNVHLGFTKQ